MIAIIIVGYKSKQYLNECLSSIFSSTYKKFKVFFLDNSNDGSVDFIKDNYPAVEIIDNKLNLGFAKGNNVVIKIALEQNFEQIFLVNPDTVIERYCLKTLMSNTKKNTILQPLILLHQDNKKTSLINTSGGSLNYLGFSYCSDYKKKPEELSTGNNRIIASGAAMMVPAKVFKKIGLFDESFFMYHEDVDLSYRARLMGCKIKLIAKAIIWHKYKFGRNANKLYLSERNRIMFVLKNYNLFFIMLIFPAALINELLLCIFALKEGWFLKKLKSYWEVIILLPYIIKNRRKIQSTRTVHEKELKDYFIPRLDFNEVKIPFARFYNSIMSYYWKFIQTFL